MLSEEEKRENEVKKGRTRREERRAGESSVIHKCSKKI
jgi:hypothetical protein